MSTILQFVVWDEEMKSRFTNVGNPEVHTDTLQSVPIATPVERERQVSSEKPAKIEAEVVPISNRHPFRGYQKGDEVAAIYQHGNTRWIIGKAIKKRKGIWPLILQVLDAGLLQPTKLVLEQPDLGILFPGAPRSFRKRYDLTKPKELKAVRDEIMPVVLDNKAAIINAPEKIDEIIKTHAQQLRLATEAERYEKKVAEAKANLKPTETEVIMFGRRFWPVVDLIHPDLAYDFETLRHAAWTFRELHLVSRLSSDSSPLSCGVRIRHIVKFLNGYLNPRVMALLNEISRALQENPDGDEKLPSMPNLDRSYD